MMSFDEWCDQGIEMLRQEYEEKKISGEITTQSLEDFMVRRSEDNFDAIYYGG